MPKDGRLRLNGLKPADVLLFWATPESATSLGISVFQNVVGISAQACSITHVALVEHADSVIHATYSPTISGHSPVRRDSLHEVCKGHTVTVVRALPVEAEADQQAVVGAAARLIGRAYSLRAIDWTALFPLLPPRAQPYAIAQLVVALSESHVCSTLVFDAFNIAMRERSPLDPGSTGWAQPIILPAFLFWNPKLTDVPLWHGTR